MYGCGGYLGYATWTIYINFLSPFPNEAPHALIGQAANEEMFGNNIHIHVHCPGVVEDNPPGVIFSLPLLFSQYSPLLQIFPIK